MSKKIFEILSHKYNKITGVCFTRKCYFNIFYFKIHVELIVLLAVSLFVKCCRHFQLKKKVKRF